jgi:hypothetical protein
MHGAVNSVLSILCMEQLAVCIEQEAYETRHEADAGPWRSALIDKRRQCAWSCGGAHME